MEEENPARWTSKGLQETRKEDTKDEKKRWKTSSDLGNNAARERKREEKGREEI